MTSAWENVVNYLSSKSDDLGSYAGQPSSNIEYDAIQNYIGCNERWACASLSNDMERFRLMLEHDGRYAAR